MKLIIGLGNLDDKYNNTRHNAGFMLINKIVKEKGLVWKEKSQWQSFIAKDTDSIYVKPTTYMNNSGEAVYKIVNYYNLLPKKLKLFTVKDYDLSDNLIIIHDEIDLPLGKYKVSTNSRSAGHRGVKSIIQHLKTKNFKRLRIGIMGNKPKQMPMKNYVLGHFDQEELKIINKNFEEITNSNIL